MSAVASVCKTGPTWLKHHHGRTSLAALTGQDARALAAFFHLVELYAVSDASGGMRALEAMHCTVLAMQPSTRWLAREAIAHVLDWGDRDRLWGLMFDPRSSPQGAVCGRLYSPYRTPDDWSAPEADRACALAPGHEGRCT